MTSKGLRRLAADHASLHTKGLPPNYLWPPGADDSFSDLTSLTILLAGATGTPFATGLFTLTLNIPSTYPQSAPTASFKTKIFHPNVDPSSGAVCVETLKRDWKPDLTLRDILITIGCLLVFPNAASALNAEAGRLVEGDFAGYERKARLWSSMHAAIPPGLQEAVDEARSRGEDDPKSQAGPSDDRRRRKEREQQRSEDVFVREDSIQTTPPKQFAAIAAPPPPQARGLGIDMMPDASLNAQLETPTQPPQVRRRKKASQAEEEEQNAPVPTSFASTLPTPTPGTRPLLHSNPSTPRLGRPEAKRRRVTPDEGIARQPELAHARTMSDRKEAPWSSWQEQSPFSSPEDARSRKKRQVLEMERLDTVAGSLSAYNAGRFGPRLGVGRL